MKLIIKLAEGGAVLRLRDNLENLREKAGIVCGEEDFTCYLTPVEVAKCLAFKNPANKGKNHYMLPAEALTHEGQANFSDKQLTDGTEWKEVAKYLKTSIDATVKIGCEGLPSGSEQMNQILQRFNDEKLELDGIVKSATSFPRFKLSGRANLAMCHGREAFSVTIRLKDYDMMTQRTKILGMKNHGTFT